MRNGPGRFYSPVAAAIQEILLVVALVLAFAIAFSMAVALHVRIAGAVGAIVNARDRTIVLVIVLRLPILLVLFLLLLPDLLLPLPLRLLPLLVVVAVVSTAAEDRKAPVRIATGTLNYQVAIRIADSALVDRVVVATLTYLIPPTVDAIAIVVAIHVGSATTEDDVSDGVGTLVIAAIAVIPAVAVIADGVAADDRHVAARIAYCPLNENVAVAVLGAAFINRIAVSVATDHAPRAIYTRSDAVARVAHGAAADDRHVAARVAYRPLNENVAVAVLGTALINRIAASIATDHAPRAINVYGSVGARERPAAINLGIERRRRSEARQR